MLAILQSLDVSLGLTMAIVIVRSTATEIRKLWKN